MRKIYFCLFSVFYVLSCKSLDVSVKPPVAKFEYTIKPNGLVVFNNLSTSADTFLWSFSNGLKSVELNPQIVFEENKEYEVELEVTNGAEKDKVKQIIKINTASLPEVIFTVKILENGKVQFINESKNAKSFLWNFGNELTSTEKEPIHEYKKNGNYEVVLNGTNFNGTTNFKNIIKVENVVQRIDISSLVLHPSNKYVEYITSNAELNDWNNENEENYIKPLTQKIYAKFQDSFDFIFIILNNTTIPQTIGYYGKYRSIKNNVQGIGQSIFDYCKSFSSDGKLKGIMQISYRSAIQNGPTLHEIAHNAANYAVPTYSIYNGAQVEYTGHWGFSDAGGQLGGFKSEFVTANLDGVAGKYQAGFNSISTGFGSFANGGNSIPYSELELYLLGLAPKEEVPNLKVYSGLSQVPNETRFGVFMAKEVKTYTINDLIAKNGTRNPSYANSQKSFRILNIILTTQPLNDDISKEIINQIDWFSYPGNDNSFYYNFYEATKGRGTLKSNEIDKTLK